MLASLAAVDFAYQSSAGQVVYRFTPATGTLSDLTVLFDGQTGLRALSPLWAAVVGSVLGEMTSRRRSAGAFDDTSARPSR